MRLFRSMKEAADGFPVIGPGARLLGVRHGDDPNPDVVAILHSDFVNPGQGGMSVAPGDPLYLPRYRRPTSLGGLGREPVWYIEERDLDADLVFHQDRVGHGLIEPNRSMRLQDYEASLTRTRQLWR